MAPRPPGHPLDAVVVGGGHNGLVAAALLGRAGRSVLVLERTDRLGGAAVSGEPFPGLPVRISRYAYLVSLFPAALVRSLGLSLRLRRRPLASYTPAGDSGVLDDGGPLLRESIARATGDPGAADAWEHFHAMVAGVARRVFPTLTEPLPSRAQMRLLLGDEHAWSAFFERPLAEVLERSLDSDLLRGIVLTDATIGTFAPADDPLLRQNRCFLYHVIGNGTGRWDVPVGGMGAVSDALIAAARDAGAQLRTDAEVVSIASDGREAEVACADGSRYSARHVLVAVAPAVLSELLGERAPGEHPEGSQLKVNMLLSRLPRLRDPHVSARDAFAGTFHVNEGYAQLQRAFEEASAGRIPTLPPCELYCHSLTDPSILSPELRAAGAHTLTLFALHMPARLFSGEPAAREAAKRDVAEAAKRDAVEAAKRDAVEAAKRDAVEAAKRDAVEATLRSVSSVLAEPLEDCLWRTDDGTLCLEALTPPELESALRMPAGHIFHRDLAWPFAESDGEVGGWGVETDRANVWLCGAGARRGGGVSGIPGHNAARAVLDWSGCPAGRSR